MTINDIKVLNLSYGNFVSLEDYMKLRKEKENLIKYLKSKLNDSIKDKFVVISVVDLLERVKNNNYE